MSAKEHNPKDATKPDLSERSFLTRQANDAKAAIKAALSDMKTDAGQAVDPRLWTKDHPWAMVAAAAVGGFAAACAAVPTKDQQAIKKLEKLEDAIFGAERRHRAREAEKEAAASKGKVPPHDKPTFLSTLAKEAFGLLKPMLTSAIAAGVSTSVANPGGNGHDTGSDATAMGAAYGSDEGGGGPVT